MRQLDWERLGAATGAISVLLFILALGTIPAPPDVDAPASEIHAYYAEEQDGIRLSLVFTAAALFFFIWFLGSLRSALRVAEGGTGRVSSIAFAGGVVSAGALFALITLIAGAAFRPDESTAEVTMGINDLAVVSGGAAAAALTALFAASAKVALRHDAFPTSVGWLLALAALAQPFALGASWS